jgi:hypothetical protein
MYPRLQNHVYQLVNDPVNGGHDHHCDLFTVVSGKRTHTNVEIIVDATPPNSFTPIKLGILSRGVNLSASRGSNENSKVRVKKSNSIHSLLVFGLTQAHLDKISHLKKYNIKDLFNTEVFQIPVCKSKDRRVRDVTVGDLTFFNPDKDNIDWKIRVQHKSKQFSQGTPLQAFIVLQVDNATYDRVNEKLIVTIGIRETEYICSRVSHHYEITAGPRLVYIVNALIDGQWDVMTIYTHPVVSNEIPVLIDSNLEREFVLEFISYHEPKLQLMKFYHAITDKSLVLLPDFKMTNYTSGNYYSEIIEVMGMVSSEAYIERKKHLIPAMESYFKLPVREVLAESLKVDCFEAVQTVKEGNKVN